MRRSRRLKEKNSGSASELQTKAEESSKEREDVDIEALASQAFEFITQRTSSNKPSHVASDVPTTEFLALPTEFRKSARDPTALASELQPQVDTDNLYLNLDPKKAIKTPNLSFDDDAELMKKSVITADFEKRDVAPPMRPSHSSVRKARKQAREESAGPMWYNLPATTVTPELKQDLKLLKMRNMLDRKRHYKKNDSGDLPKYFQVGTVVAGSADFYSSRIPKGQRKQTLVDELLADTEFRRYNKKKYLEIQKSKQSGRKGFYKKKMNKRKATWARKS